MCETLEVEKLISKTEVKDDIDVLINIICQLADRQDEEILADEGRVTTQIPDPSIHCKYWESFGVPAIVTAIEKKYANAKKMDIPKEFLTSY